MLKSTIHKKSLSYTDSRKVGFLTVEVQFMQTGVSLET